MVHMPILPAALPSSFILLKKLHCGDVDAIKSAKILLRNVSILSYCLLLMDEMYLQNPCSTTVENILAKTVMTSFIKGFFS